MQKSLNIILNRILILVAVCSDLMAHSSGEMRNSIYSFEDKILELCLGHGEEHMSQAQIELILKEVKDNYSIMLSSIDKTETERFLVRLTNVVIQSELPPTKKNRFYRVAYEKSQELETDERIWSDLTKLLIRKTSILSREELKGHMSSSDYYLREAARKELMRRSEKKEVNNIKQPQGEPISRLLEKDESSKGDQAKQSLIECFYWILGLMISGGLFFLILNSRKDASAS